MNPDGIHYPKGICVFRTREMDGQPCFLLGLPVDAICINMFNVNIVKVSYLTEL